MEKYALVVETFFMEIIDNILQLLTFSGGYLLPLLTILIFLGIILLPILLLFTMEIILFRDTETYYRGKEVIFWSTIGVQVVWVFAALEFLWKTLV